MTTSNVKLPCSSPWAGGRTGWGPEELWLCDTHLLCVRNIFGMETYQRFYYRDIERVSVKVTCFGAWITWVNFALLVLVLLLLSYEVLPLLLGVPVCMLTAVFAGLNMTDSTCRVVLATRVNTRHLTGLAHVRVARRALALLCERVCAAQAEAYRDAPPPVPAVADAAVEGVPAWVVPPPLPVAAKANWWWHVATVAVMVAQVAVAAVMAVRPEFALGIVSSLLVFLCVPVCMVAFIVQRRMAVAASLRTACLVVLLYQILVSCVLGVMFQVWVSGVSRGLVFSAETFAATVESTGVLVPVQCASHAVIVLCLAVWFSVQVRGARKS